MHTVVCAYVSAWCEAFGGRPRYTIPDPRFPVILMTFALWYQVKHTHKHMHAHSQIHIHKHTHTQTFTHMPIVSDKLKNK